MRNGLHTCHYSHLRDPFPCGARSKTGPAPSIVNYCLTISVWSPVAGSPQHRFLQTAFWGAWQLTGPCGRIRLMKVPQPFPYQGSKRNLAPLILGYFPEDVRTLIEPFAGSAAITLEAAMANLAENFIINDLNGPLAELWRAIIVSPDELARQYESVWRAQHSNRRSFYDDVRDRFNRTGKPDHLLYLLARCVKAAVRYNANGEFNQSPDNRRMGMLPATMRENILATSALLRGRTECSSLDYKEVVANATTPDLTYLDPPSQGVCGERAPRYLKAVLFDEFVEV